MNELENVQLAQSLTNRDGSVSAPCCCGVPMVCYGGCSEGCCDDYRCATCDRSIRVQWPD